MYIWVVLATFLAILASYILAPRADYRQLTVEPLAEATIAKIVTKHQAARDYVRFHKKPYVTFPSEDWFRPGIIDDADLDPYILFGHVNTDEFTSQIFCMSEDMTVAYADQANCNVRKNKKMVVTYGPLPARWINQSTDLETPNNDFMNAMRNSVDSGTSFGYTAEVENVNESDRNVSKSTVRIIDRDYDQVFVPKAVVNDSSFKEICDLGRGKVCLVYQSGI